MQTLFPYLGKTITPAIKLTLQIAGATTIVLLAQAINQATRDWATQELGFDPWKK